MRLMLFVCCYAIYGQQSKAVRFTTLFAVLPFGKMRELCTHSWFSLVLCVATLWIRKHQRIQI